MSNALLDHNKLKDWLRQQDPNEEYIWSDPVFCMMGRYLADHGSSWGEVGYSDMPYYYEIASYKPWTFGAALKRADGIKEALSPPDEDRWQHSPGTMLPAPALQLEDKRETVTVA